METTSDIEQFKKKLQILLDMIKTQQEELKKQQEEIKEQQEEINFLKEAMRKKSKTIEEYQYLLMKYKIQSI